jgi:glycosyltransferase involved in cell wall biosynthesis
MKVIIYHPNSFGGTYEHAQHIHKEYIKQLGTGNCEILFPVIAKAQHPDFKKILLTDLPAYGKLVNKLHFLYRTFLNPLLLLLYMRKQPNAVILFNEFDQFSMWFWGPIFSLLKGRHTYAIILHDPDRDAYAGKASLSAWFMRKVMLPMDIVFYHEVLPERSYYTNLPKTCFVNVMLGLMPKHQPDASLCEQLAIFTENRPMMSILGNIRYEKNYGLAIESLVQFPELVLVVGGRPSSSVVDVSLFQKQAEELGVANRILWLVRFLSDSELASVISASSISYLNYSATFKSQSGVMTLVAPYRIPILASDGESALAAVVRKYNLGVLVEPDDQESLNQGISRILSAHLPEPAWQAFEEFASWETNVKISIAAFEVANSK